MSLQVLVSNFNLFSLLQLVYFIFKLQIDSVTYQLSGNQSFSSLLTVGPKTPKRRANCSEPLAVFPALFPTIVPFYFRRT